MEEYHNPYLNAMNGGSGVPLNNEPIKQKEEKPMTDENIDNVEENIEDKPKKGKKKKFVEDKSVSDMPDMPDMSGMIDMPDFMMPDEEYEDAGAIEDTIKGAFNWAFIGAGQAGSRIAESLYKMGYKRVCCINTTQQDLVNINIPEENKFLMEMEDSGTAKNPEAGAKAVKEYREDVYDLMRRSWGTQFDRILVISSLGGGCINEGTTIYSDSHGFIPIDDLWKYAVKQGQKKGVIPIYDTCGDRILDISSLGIHTYGLDEDTGKTELCQINQVRQVEVSQDCRMDLKLRNGSETTVSDWHPYFTLSLDDNLPVIVEKKASQLQKRDLVFVPNVEINSFDGCLGDYGKYWLAGMTAGDGNFADEYTMRIISMDNEIFDKCKEVVRKFYPHINNNFHITDKKDNKANVLNIYGKEIISEISDMIGGFKRHKIYNWEISSEIQTGYEKGNAFLAGLFDADGYVSTNSVGISLANEKAIKQISQMLSIRGMKFYSRVNVPTKVGHSDMHEVFLLQDSIKKFNETIGKYIVCNRKLDELKIILSRSNRPSIKGLNFKYIKGIFNALRVNLPVANNSLDGLDLTCWAYAKEGKNNDKGVSHDVFRKTIVLLKSEYEKFIKVTDFTLFTNDELCKIAGISKESLAQIFNIGSYKRDQLYRFNLCDTSTRKELEKMALDYIASPIVRRIPATLDLLEKCVHSVSPVVSIEKSHDKGQFYDLSIDKHHSYCASRTGALCFTHNSGSGSIDTLIDISHDICQSFKIETGVSGEAVSVGALVALPKSNEGEKVNRNAYEGLKKLSARVGVGNGKLDGRDISPLIVVDNDKIHKMYPKLPVSKFWSVANQSITSLFSLFNTISIQDSEFTTFDPAEYKDVLQSGVVSFGACPITKWSDASDISYAIRDNLKKNILVSGLDLSKANVAACVFVAHPDVLDEIPQEYIDHGVESLTRIMGKGSSVHPGIFKGNIKDSKGNPSMRVYTFIGGLGEPEERLEEIARLGKIVINNNRR